MQNDKIPSFFLASAGIATSGGFFFWCKYCVSNFRPSLIALNRMLLINRLDERTYTPATLPADVRKFVKGQRDNLGLK
jgi:hypothetical protein